MGSTSGGAVTGRTWQRRSRSSPIPSANVSPSGHRLADRCRTTRSDADLIALCPGRVVECLAVSQDFASGTVGCRDRGRACGSADRVTAALTCYEDHCWEIEGVYCGADAVDSVAATLEVTGSHPSRGTFRPDALAPGAVEVLDYSPTADGY